LDAACREHGIAYSRSNDLDERHVADRVLAGRARERIIARDSTLGERAAATAVWAAMKAKTKLGMRMKKPSMTKRRKKRIFPVAKRDGILPLLPLLGDVGSLAGGAAGVAKAVNDNRRCNVSWKKCGVTIALWKVADFTSLHTSVDRDSQRSLREKKRREKIKSAYGYDN